MNNIHRLTLMAVSLFTLTLLTSRSAQAQTQTMGNPPAGSGSGGVLIATEDFNTEGYAVGFTPLQNVGFDSVTVWLNGYTGQSLFPNWGVGGVTLSVNLMTDASSYSPPLWFSGPAAIIATAYAAPNNGSDAAFTVDLSGSLQANTPYWLFLYLEAGLPDGYDCYWDLGGTPVGDVVINGSEHFEDGSFSSLGSVAPAFALNSPSPAVPEPSTGIVGALLLIPLGVSVLRKLRKA